MSLPIWTAALARVKAGTGNARVVCVGDSTTFGYGSTAGGNIPPFAWPKLVSDLFNNAGINSQWNSWMGVGTSGGGFVGYQYFDTRLTFGSAWANAAYPTFSVGGYPMSATTNTNAISFLPTVNVDTFNVFYVQDTAGGLNPGSFTMNINGGSNTTVNTQGASKVSNATITGTLGSNTLNINWSTGGGVYIVGAEAYDSSKSWVSMINCGWTGSSSKTWTADGDLSNNYSPCNGLAYMGQALTIIDLGINDWNNSIGTTNYSTYMQDLITAALASGGDVLLVKPSPTNPSGGISIPVQQSYLAVIDTLAASNNLAVCDVYDAFGSWATANSNGYMFDSLHPNESGYSAVYAPTVFNSINLFQSISAPSIPVYPPKGFVPSLPLNAQPLAQVGATPLERIYQRIFINTLILKQLASITDEDYTFIGH
jgi:lysophospholipase L1-like esterase